MRLNLDELHLSSQPVDPLLHVHIPCCSNARHAECTRNKFQHFWHTLRPQLCPWTDSIAIRVVLTRVSEVSVCLNSSKRWREKWIDLECWRGEILTVVWSPVDVVVTLLSVFQTGAKYYYLMRQINIACKVIVLFWLIITTTKCIVSHWRT